MNTLKGRLRSVVILGYYGFGNAGDELILRALLIALRNEGFDGDIRVLSGNPLLTESEHNIKAVNRWSPWAVVKAIYQCDLFIFGGGGLLQDSTGSPGLWYYLLLLWIGIVLKKRIVACSVGVGPMHVKINRLLVAMTLNCIEKITVRDYESLLDLKMCDVNQEIEIKADPVLSLDIPVPDYNSGRPDEKRKIGIIIRNSSVHKNIFRQLARTIHELKGKLNADAMILPFHPRLDKKAVDELMVHLQGKASVMEWNRIDDVIQFFSHIDFVLSMRLHGAILAALTRRPVVGIVVDPKIRFFLNEFKCSEYENTVEMDELGQQNLSDKIVKSFQSREAFVRSVAERIPNLRERALIHLRV